MARSREKDSAENQLIKAIRNLGQSQGLNNAFSTFLEIMATSLGMTMDPVNAQERKERYEELVADMKPEVVTAYARMCALMYLAVKENMEDPRDVLGYIYHELKLNNEWNGQYFTPDGLSRLMANLAWNPSEEQDGIITVNEPTCGSGTMVIGAIWVMQCKGFDYQHKALFIAQDIDIRCVWMAYIQLCLYKIPAVVIHGNTLTLEAWSQWFTPLAIPLLMAENKNGTSDDAEVAG